MSKLQQLQASLSPSKAYWVESSVNRRYLTGFRSSAGVLLITRQESYFFTDFRYIEKAQLQIRDSKVILLQDASEQIDGFLKKHNITTLCLESDNITLERYDTLKEWFPTLEFDISANLCREIKKMRCCKDAKEVESIARAQRISERAFDALLGWITPGQTERQIAARLEVLMKEYGSEGVSFDTIVLAGQHTSLPHGEPSEYKVQKGDLLLFDFGSTVNGYHSDMTRTVALGSISQHQRTVYDTVLQAQLCALESIQPGKHCAEIDAAARNYIDACGYGGCFGHSLGHSVGLQIHESPNFSQLEKEVVQPGFVMTVEPGIYLAGQFGVRIEDMVCITEHGYENLTQMSKELIVL